MSIARAVHEYAETLLAAILTDMHHLCPGHPVRELSLLCLACGVNCKVAAYKGATPMVGFLKPSESK